MNNNFYPKVFIPIQMGEGLPAKEGWYSIFNNETQLYDCWFDFEEGWHSLSTEATHWLEPISNRYLLSAKDLEDLITDAFVEIKFWAGNEWKIARREAKYFLKNKITK